MYQMIIKMKELTKAEEEIMQVLWSLEKASIKDVIACMKEPKPAYNTVSTIVRILERKEFVGHSPKGRGFIYFPLVEKEAYSKQSLDKIVGNYFQGSLSSMVSFFVKSNEMKTGELDEIMQIIEASKNKEQ